MKGLLLPAAAATLLVASSAPGLGQEPGEQAVGPGPTTVVSLALQESPDVSHVVVTADRPLEWSLSPTEGGAVVELADAEPGAGVTYELTGTVGPVTAVRLRERGQGERRSVLVWIETASPGAPFVRADGSSLTVEVGRGGRPAADAPATIVRGFVATPHGEPEPYRIGPGDILEIDVLGISELDRRVRVGEDGAVPLPLVGRIEVQGLSVLEAEERVARTLVAGGVLNEPRVIVTLAEASRDAVAVHGAVVRPGLYALPRPATVMEVLTWAGGLAEEAAAPARAILLRGDQGAREPRSVVDLAALLGGASNEPDPTLFPGDALLVPAAEVVQVFVAGAVRRPGTVSGRPADDLDVLEALALAGGATERGSLDKASVSRSGPFGKRTTIRVDIDATQRGRIPPLPLQAGDVLYVPFWPAFGQHYDVTARELMERQPPRQSDDTSDAPRR